jgi:hypothetical protein
MHTADPSGVTMARFPLRALGLLLLTVTILGASCQALFAESDLRPAPALEQITRLLTHPR